MTKIGYNTSINLLYLLLAKVGQRAMIGKTCMDRNSPYYYFETSNQAMNSTLRYCITTLEIFTFKREYFRS